MLFGKYNYLRLHYALHRRGQQNILQKNVACFACSIFGDFVVIVYDK